MYNKKTKKLKIYLIYNIQYFILNYLYVNKFVFKY